MTDPSVRDQLFQFMGTKPETAAAAPKMQAQVPSARVVNFLDHYELGRNLGSGSFSSVSECRDRRTGEARAVKILKKSPNMNYEALRREVDILSGIEHPHVVKLYDVIEDTQHVYIVLELMRGGELFERIVKMYPKGYTEATCAALFANLLSAVAHLHKYGIIHRDLKPENLLLSSSAADCCDVKVSDFGFATSRLMARSACGSPCYLAPEIIRNAAAIQRAPAGGALVPYTNAVDVWSLGVILYVMLCGFAPFRERHLAHLFQRILDCEFTFPSPHWDAVSPLAKDLISAMVRADPTARITAAAALAHPWFAAQLGPQAAAAAAAGGVGIPAGAFGAGAPGVAGGGGGGATGPLLAVSASLSAGGAQQAGGGPRGSVELTPDVLASLRMAP